MRLFLFCIFSLQFFFSYGQSDWAEIGTKWWYEQITIGPPYNTSYHLIEVEKDTMINNKVVKKLDWKVYYISSVWQNPALYTFEDSGQIYFMYENDSFEYKLYDFNATFGDTVTLHAPKFSGTGGGIDSIYVLIDSIKSVNFNGVYKNVYYNSIISQTSHTFGNWIQGVGSDYFFLPQYGTIDPPETGRLRCFEDVNDGLIKFTNLACDTIMTGVLDPSINSDIKLFPNPANDKIRVSGFEYIDIQKIEVIDIAGKKLIEKLSLSQKDFREFSVKDLQSGIYFIRIFNKEGQYFSIPFIKK